MAVKDEVEMSDHGTTFQYIRTEDLKKSQCFNCHKRMWFWQRKMSVGNFGFGYGTAHEKCESQRRADTRAYLLSGNSPLGGMPAIVEELLKRE